MSVDNLIQYLVEGGISVAAILGSLKFGLKSLAEDIKEIKMKIESIGVTTSKHSETLAVHSYRLDALDGRGTDHVDNG